MKKDNSDLQRVVLGRFDSTISLTDVESPRHLKPIRIASKKPSDVQFFDFEPIATDGESIFHNNKCYPSRDWLSNLAKTTASRLIVLTVKERNLLLDVLVDMNFDVHVFEVNFPIFNEVRYVSCMRTNHATLVKMLAQLHKKGIRGRSLGEATSTEFLYRIERKLRFKNGFDRYFSLAFRSPYQEVFRLNEERSDRVIIAFDFNSMYASCMRGRFLEPKAIRYIDFRGSQKSVEALAAGFYRVLLKCPKPGFFRACHPFRYAIQNKQFYFELDGNHELEILLFNNEIEVYARYFDKVEILEGFVSSTTVVHPLLAKAENVYNKRQHYKKQSNMGMEAFCKFQLATMHSATNQRRYIKRHFHTLEEILIWLDKYGLFEFPAEFAIEEKLRIAHYCRHLNIRQATNGFIAKMLRFDSPSNVFSLSAQINANSRIVMIRTIERFLKHSTVELCYCNVDSLHISINKSELNSFLKAHSDIISDRMGDLKIQAIADKGYWFDIGRYWLFKKQEIVLFRNQIFNQKMSQYPFIRFKKINLICKGDVFSYLKTRYFTIEKSFSYVKKVHTNTLGEVTDYCRYNYHEVSSLDTACETLDQEILRSKLLKIKLFDKIAITST
jgi:hypothetical protein